MSKVGKYKSKENISFIEDLEVTPLPFEAKGVDYPIEIDVLPQKEEYFFKFTFAENLFKQKTGESFAENYLKVMGLDMDNWDIYIGQKEGGPWIHTHTHSLTHIHTRTHTHTHSSTTPRGRLVSTGQKEEGLEA